MFRILLVLCALSAVCVPVARAEDDEEPPPVKQIPINIKVPSEEQALHLWLRERYAMVPEYVGKLNKEKRDEVVVVIDSIVYGGKLFLEKYPKSEHLEEVCGILSHSMVMNRKRALKAIRDEFKEASGETMSAEDFQSESDGMTREIEQIIALGLSGNPTPAERAVLSMARGELKSGEQKHLEAAEALRAALAADPSGRHAESCHFSLIAALYSGRRFDEVRTLAEEFLERYPGSPRGADAMRAVHDSYLRRGMIEEHRDYLNGILPRLVAGAAGTPMPPRGRDPGGWVVAADDRKAYRSERDLVPANLGIAAFARFEYEEARRQFDIFLSSTADYEARSAAGDPVGEAVDVTRRFIVLPLNLTVTSLVGKEAPALDTVEWIDPPAADGAKPRVRVLVLAAHNTAVARQKGFMQLLGTLERENAGVLAVTWLGGLGRLRKGETAEEKAEEMRKAARDFGLECALGWDTDNALHDALMRDPGTPTVYLIDAEDKIIWQALDPMDWNEGLYRRVFRQALGAK